MVVGAPYLQRRSIKVLAFIFWPSVNWVQEMRLILLLSFISLIVVPTKADIMTTLFKSFLERIPIKGRQWRVQLFLFCSIF